MKKSENFWLKFTLAVSSMALMIDLAIYPAADAIYTVFAEENTVLVNFIITGPSLMIVLGSILCGFMTQKVGKKKILAVSYLIFCIASIFAGVIDQVFYLVSMRTIAGLAVGFISISSAGLIAELFTDENTMSRVMGTYTGVMSILGSMMSFFAGYLALIDWHYVFIVYIIAIPILVLVLLFIPNTPPEGMSQIETEDRIETVKWSRPLSLAGAAFVLNAAYAVVLTMMAVFLAEQKIGNSATAGTIGTITTLGSMAACFLFSKIYMLLKQKTPIVFSAIMGAGFVFLASSNSVVVISAAAFFMGAMYGMSYSYYLMYAAMIVPGSKSSLSISIANAAVYLGLFCGPYVCPFYETVFHVETMAASMPYIAGTCFLYTVLSSVLYIRKKKKESSAG